MLDDFPRESGSNGRSGQSLSKQAASWRPSLVLMVASPGLQSSAKRLKMVLRTTADVNRLAFHHFFCRAIPHSQGAQRVVDLLRSQEGEFVHGRTVITRVKKIPPLPEALQHGPDPNFVPEPGAVIDENDGICGLLNLQHRLLALDVWTVNQVRQGTYPAGAPAFGNFGFDAKNCGIIVGQWASFREGDSPDGVANGLLALATHFYPCLRPQYGWVDEAGWNLPEGKALAALRPRYLFWANFFGPEYVQAIGREFLKRAPGWVSVDLPDGGILHVCTESYQDWWENDQPEVLAYFRRKIPKVQIYRAQPIPY